MNFAGLDHIFFTPYIIAYNSSLTPFNPRSATNTSIALNTPFRTDKCVNSFKTICNGYSLGVGELKRCTAIKSEEQYNKYGNLIRDEGKRLGNMVEQVLDFAGIKSKTFPKILSEYFGDKIGIIDEELFLF